MAGDRTVTLYLVRHAFAGHADPARWPDDSIRPLTPDGIRRFEAAARGLRRLVPEVDLVLSSGYVRAWDTAELLHEVTGWPKPLECTALEADQAPDSVLDVLRERTEQSIALVGHDPHLSRLASILCAGEEDVLWLELKKGGVLRIDGDAAPGAAFLRWALPPKVLRALETATAPVS